MSVTAGIISGFDQARRTFRDAELAKAARDQDREFSILSALAQHIDPELAQVGAAGLLNLAQGGTPRTGKGLSGFLGEVDKSSHMPALQTLFGSGGASPVSAAPAAGTAAQPNSAMVDPERVNARITPPTMGGNPAEEQVGARVAPPEFGAETPESAMGGTQAPQFGMPGIPMAPQGPPPPETPQARSKRLYPTAGEIAAEQMAKTLQARIQTVFEGIRMAKNPDEVDIVRGLAGAPRRQATTKMMNARYLDTASGEEVEGTVVFNPVDGTAEVNGQPVQVTKLLGANTPRPIGVNIKAADGTINRAGLDPTTGRPLWTVETGMPVPADPPEYGGTATVNGQVVQVPRRADQAPRVLGNAPQPAGVLSADQQEATGWVTDVNAEIKAELSRRNTGKPSVIAEKALPIAQQNAIVAKVTKGRYKTLGELTAATKRTVGGGGDNRRDLGNRVRQRLERGDSSTIQGSGIPQY